MSVEKSVVLLTAADIQRLPPGVLLDTLQIMARDSGAGDVHTLVLSSTGEHTAVMRSPAPRGQMHPFHLVPNGELIEVEAFGMRRANLYVSFGEIQRFIYEGLSPYEQLQQIKLNFENNHT